MNSICNCTKNIAVKNFMRRLIDHDLNMIWQNRNAGQYITSRSLNVLKKFYNRLIFFGENKEILSVDSYLYCI